MSESLEFRSDAKTVLEFAWMKILKKKISIIFNKVPLENIFLQFSKKIQLFQNNSTMKKKIKNFKNILLWTSRSVWVTKENCYFGLQVSVSNPNSLCIPNASTCP